MPLKEALRKEILTYCDRDLPPKNDVGEMFDFITEEKLRNRIEAEFHAARYIYKLGEALAVKDERLHAHVKFQIVQYAGIYEAVIVHLLWSNFRDRPEVIAIEFHQALKKFANLPSTVQMTTSDGEELFLSVKREERTPPVSIKFDDKVSAAVAIGFVDADIGEEIKGFYKLRNAIHLESAVKNEIKYEIDSSLLAYRRMLPFTRGVRGFLADGVLPRNARRRQIEKQPTSTP
jgi:hypothetical protein